MRRTLMLLVLPLILLLSQPVFAANPPESAIASGQLTNIRWSTFSDSGSGTSRLRIVFDVSEPVKAEAKLDNQSRSLLIDIKGAAPGNNSEVTLDGRIAERLTVSPTDTYGLRAAIDLPLAATENDYKVFTLAKDDNANKPFRVVVDITKKLDIRPEEGEVKTLGIAEAVSNTPEIKPAVQIPQTVQTSAAVGLIKQPAVVEEAYSEITNIRWASHTDAVTGTEKLRVVFDVSGPVQAEASVTAAPTPRLLVDLKGAVPGKTESMPDFGGGIVDKASIYLAGKNNTNVAFDLPLMIEDSDYRVFTLPGDAKGGKPYRIVVDINKKVPPMDFKFTPGLKKKLIVIDPGHGGSDPGAVGPGKTQEKTVTLAVAKEVKDLLEKAGAKVLMTRETDKDVFGPQATAVEELKARITVGNNKKADAFISIHADAFTNSAAGGTSTYYYQKTPYDALLARSLQASMVPAGGLRDRGANPANFYVIKRTIMPAALVELAFISNPAEEKLLTSPQFQQKMAQAIVSGLENFFVQASRLGGGN